MDDVQVQRTTVECLLRSLFVFSLLPSSVGISFISPPVTLLPSAPSLLGWRGHTQTRMGVHSDTHTDTHGCALTHTDTTHGRALTHTHRYTRHTWACMHVRAHTHTHTHTSSSEIQGARCSLQRGEWGFLLRYPQALTLTSWLSDERKEQSRLGV